VNEVTSRGGQEFPSLDYERRRWNVGFPTLRMSETWGYADVLSQYSATGSNALFIPDTTSIYLQQEAIFGRLKAAADITSASHGRPQGMECDDHRATVARDQVPLIPARREKQQTVTPDLNTTRSRCAPFDPHCAGLIGAF
jgi:hypothetical protein